MLHLENFHTMPSWGAGSPGRSDSQDCNTFFNFEGTPWVDFYIFWVETFEGYRHELTSSTYSYPITMVPSQCHTPTLAENDQNDTFLDFYVRQIDMLSRNTRLSHETHLRTYENQVQSPRAPLGSELDPFAELLTFLPREEKNQKKRRLGINPWEPLPGVQGPGVNTWKARIYNSVTSSRKNVARRRRISCMSYMGFLYAPSSDEYRMCLATNISLP